MGAALLYMMFTPIQVSLPAPARTREGGWNTDALDEKYRSARRDLLHIVGWTFGCIFLELISLLTASTSSLPRLMTCNVVAHICGGFFTLWMTLDGWTYVAAIGIFVIFALIPAMSEVAVMTVLLVSNIDRAGRRLQRRCFDLCGVCRPGRL